MRPTRTRLQQELTRRFRPEAVRGLEVRLRLHMPDADPFDLIVGHGTLAVTDDISPAPDVTFFFDDLHGAWDIMTGRANAIEAFMRGQFRADGYLMLAFWLMEVFGSTSLPPTPND